MTWGIINLRNSRGITAMHLCSREIILRLQRINHNHAVPGKDILMTHTIMLDGIGFLILISAIPLMFSVLMAVAADTATSEIVLQRVLRTAALISDRFNVIVTELYLARPLPTDRRFQTVLPGFQSVGADYEYSASFQNADLLTAFNRRLMEFWGMPEHLALVAKFGGRGPNCRTARQRKPAGARRRFEVIYCPRYPIPLLAAGT